MKKYYVNNTAQPGGEHEVHDEDCEYLPSPFNRTYVGIHSTCKDAVEAARRVFQNVDGCYYCSRPCHKR